LDIGVDVQLVKVESPEQAKKAVFYGSPTIKIDGVDMEGKTGEPSFNCRLYDVEGHLTGIPPKAFIRQKLQNIG